jgi:hypothetical protein
LVQWSLRAGRCDTVAAAEIAASKVMSGLPLRIAGFGACMITGYPHKGGGLFEIACGLIEKGLSRPVESTIVSLGGFPAPRAEKYLKHKIKNILSTRYLTSIRVMSSSSSGLLTHRAQFEKEVARRTAAPDPLPIAASSLVRIWEPPPIIVNQRLWSVRCAGSSLL